MYDLAFIRKRITDDIYVKQSSIVTLKREIEEREKRIIEVQQELEIAERALKMFDYGKANLSA